MTINLIMKCNKILKPLLYLSVVSCDKIVNPYAPLDKIDPCDPASNTYSDKKHFIERDYLNEDRQIDYKKMIENLDKRSSPCDPLNPKKKTLKDIPKVE
jgi:hypothetical protein